MKQATGPSSSYGLENMVKSVIDDLLGWVREGRGEAVPGGFFKYTFLVHFRYVLLNLCLSVHVCPSVEKG